MLQKLTDDFPTVTALLLLLPFAVSVAYMWPWISNDLAHTAQFAKCSVWISELVAVYLVLHWLFVAKSRSSQCSNTTDDDQHIRRLIFVMMLGLYMDMAWTVYGIYDITKSYRRSVGGIATIDGVSSTKVDRFFVQHTNYKIDFSFTDLGGAPHSAHATFTENSDQPIRKWAQKVKLAIQNGKKTVPIKFDPQSPDRVWIAKQPITDLCMLSVLFLTMHFCQLCTLSQQRRDSETTDQERLRWQIRHFPLLPLAFETPFVCMVALFYWLNGGF